MKHVKAEDLMAFAKTLKGETLQTLYRPKPFTVIVEDDLLIVKTSTGKSRRAYKDGAVKTICDRYSASDSLVPKEYGEFWEKSYVLALIKRFNEGRQLATQS